MGFQSDNSKQQDKQRVGRQRSEPTKNQQITKQTLPNTWKHADILN